MIINILLFMLILAIILILFELAYISYQKAKEKEQYNKEHLIKLP